MPLEDRMRSWWKKQLPATGKTATEAKGAEINRLAAELQIVAGGKGVTTGDAITAFATALVNEIAAAVMRNPGLTVNEMLDLGWPISARDGSNSR